MKKYIPGLAQLYTFNIYVQEMRCDSWSLSVPCNLYYVHRQCLFRIGLGLDWTCRPMLS